LRFVAGSAVPDFPGYRRLEVELLRPFEFFIHQTDAAPQLSDGLTAQRICSAPSASAARPSRQILNFSASNKPQEKGFRII
jgi:hypothetical protein